MTVHISPLNDLIKHELDGVSCVCGPEIEYADPETAETYPDGPLITHWSLDGREFAHKENAE